LVDLFRGEACPLGFFEGLSDLTLDLFDSGYVFFTLLNLGLAKRFSNLRHLLEVRSHPISSGYF
jgi:hypothetical protein